MKRTFNKAVAFAFFFLVSYLNPLEFRIMQQRTKGSLKTNKICYLIVSIDQDMTLGLH